MNKHNYFFIHCGTGCTCCNSENHYRGPYASRGDAERRIAYFNAPDSKFWPLASQYARRGSYSITEREVEFLSDGRWIVEDRIFAEEPIKVEPNGSLEMVDEGELVRDTYWW